MFVTKSTKEACSSEESDVDADSSHAKNKTNEDREPNGKISCSLDDAINKNIGSFIEIDVSEDMDDFGELNKINKNMGVNCLTHSRLV